MNLKKAQKNLEKMFDEVYGDVFEVEYEYASNDMLVAKTFLGLKDSDTDFLFQIMVSDMGMVGYEFIFDDIEKNEHTLDLINTYNSNEHSLKAYIDEDNGLGVQHRCILVDEDTIAEYTSRVIDVFFDDEALEDLKPLLDLTIEEE